MIQVSVATPSHVKDAAHTIVQAFIGDPFNLYLYNYIADQDHPPWGTEEMMALRIWLTMVSELVLVAEDGDSRCAGVALWGPPQSEPLSWGVWARLTARSMYMRLACLYYGSRGVNLKRIKEFRKVQEETLDRILGKDYHKNTYYLNILGTHPDHRRRGIGAALVRYITKEADERGCRCVLEAPKYFPNVPFYETLGFRVVETAVLRDGEDYMEVLPCLK